MPDFWMLLGQKVQYVRGLYSRYSGFSRVGRNGQ